MITCNRCGSVNPAGASACQRCGLALTKTDENRMIPGMGVQELPPPPPWLESLRSNIGDQSVAPTGGPSNFHAPDLIDANALPSWLRSGQADVGSASANAAHALRPAGQKAPNTDENYLAGRGISANSLIDQQALPSWMRQDQANDFDVPPRNISGASLVQPDTLPDWMKEAQPPNSPRNPPQSATLSSLRESLHPPTPPAQKGFSAQDLIDPNALPSWMTQGKSQAGQKMPEQGATFSASSLIDANSLPSWMRPEDDRQQAAHSGQPIVTGNSQGQRSAYNMPPRVENVRVPSRPRGEATNEGIEVAASTFASVLGVASNVPNFPQYGPQATPMGQKPQGAPPYQAQQSGPMNMPPHAGGGPVQASSQSLGGYPPPQSQGPATNMGQGYAQPGYNSYQGNYPPMGAPSMPNVQQGPNMGYNSVQPPQTMGNIGMPTDQANAKPAKRGIFEVIRSWFLRP